MMNAEKAQLCESLRRAIHIAVEGQLDGMQNVNPMEIISQVLAVVFPEIIDTFPMTGEHKIQLFNSILKDAHNRMERYARGEYEGHEGDETRTH